ncbi:alpha/beta hydrolase [Chitinophagaceae bacterium LB-8]|jgi:pimeloyl-ACP methyl ester carboxylesterase|uniref:Alpha/beta hydrolase n=1 Tax=Paraflavisolibacter caeni TaxID=2982496 RepID=A0A9X3BGJ7_9BACT|nr:alpha/beta hydrolase [Paraflavisolibacter caeni]MCU7551049.1 alpha/beta hydrolase [Paraflavisolibacter caeni]
MMHQKEISYHSKRLVYRIQGEGPLVVLLHGFGEDGIVWTPQFDIFPNNTLIIPDLPGSGQSEIIADMSMEGLADAIREIIKTEQKTQSNSNPAIMIGHSMGGYITLAYAEKYFDDLAAFGLFHSTAFADTEEKKDTRRKGIDFVQKHGAFEFLKTAIPNMYSPGTKEFSPELIEAHLQSLKEFSKAALIAYYESMIRRPDRTHVLRQNKIPVLFVLGKHDAAVPLQDGLQQTHLPGISQVYIMENSGHMGMREEEDKSNLLLKEFVQLSGSS